MAADLPLRLKRREIVLLVIIFLLTFGVYRSITIVDDIWRDTTVVQNVLNQQPLGVGGKLVFIWLGRIFVELGKTVWAASPIQSLSFSSMLFGALASVNIYFAYRSLFNQRYIGIVASLILAFSPWYFHSSTSPEKYAISLFFVMGTVWAWAAKSWIVWGLMFGLALASHPASAILLLPFAGHAYVTRNGRSDIKSMFVGVIVAVVIFLGLTSLAPGSNLGSANWISGIQSLGLGKRLSISLNAIQPIYWIILLIYLAIIVAFAYVFRHRKKISRYGFTMLLVAIPYLVIFYFNLQPILGIGGVALTALSLLAVPALWAVEDRKEELIFLLLWLLPSLIVFPLLGFSAPALYGFIAPPLVLLTCRLVDKSLDGEWLDLWWALGLPSSWYYRMGKALVLAILVISFYQSARA